MQGFYLVSAWGALSMALSCTRSCSGTTCSPTGDPPTLEAMHVNMVWDGLFHAVVWLVTLVGVFLLWSAAYHRERIPLLREFVGRLLFGWGWFNLVEGIIDHQLLGVHYVRQVANYTIYNMTFLAMGGVGFILVGWLLMRTGRRDVIEV